MTAGKKWWEKEPPRFECQTDCFKCCAKPGIVYFDKKSIENASKITKLSPARFKKEFLEISFFLPEVIKIIKKLELQEFLAE